MPKEIIKKTPEAKELHKIILEIYDIFKKICEKEGYRYFAISGTTIGAGFWKGIIPWDDDMDIAMPIEDYEKFTKKYRSEKLLPEHIRFIEYSWFGCKLHDDRTTFTNLHYITDTKRYNGVFIDIVPIFALPEDEASRNKIITSLHKYTKNALLMDRYGFYDDVKDDAELKELKDFILHSYRFGETPYVMDFSDPRYILDSKGFENPIDMPFENTTIPVSSNWKNDLKIQYKNFQKYPPKEVRQSSHQLLGVLDFKKGYESNEKEFHELPEWITNIVKGQHIFEGQSVLNTYRHNDNVNKLNQELFDLQSKYDALLRAYNESYPKKLLKKIRNHFIKQKP